MEWPKEWKWAGWEEDQRLWENHPQNGTFAWWRVQDWKRGYLVYAPTARQAFLSVIDRLVNPSTTRITWIGVELPWIIEATGKDEG